MILRISSEVSVWQVIDNMQYFDKDTFEPTKQWPGFIATMMPSCTYDDERAIINAFREIKRMGDNLQWNINDMRLSVSSYTVIDLLEDILHKRPSQMFIAGDEKTFEFWLKMYQRRHVSRALVPWDLYNTIIPDRTEFYNKLVNEAAIVYDYINDLVTYKDANKLPPLNIKYDS